MLHLTVLQHWFCAIITQYRVHKRTELNPSKQRMSTWLSVPVQSSDKRALVAYLV